MRIPPVNEIFQKVPKDHPHESIFGYLFEIVGNENKIKGGTAFLIAPGYAVTALHVLDDLESLSVNKSKLNYSSGEFIHRIKQPSPLLIVLKPKPLYVLEVSYVRPGDIAILKVAKSPDIKWNDYGAIPPLRLSFPKLETHIRAFGCPNSTIALDQDRATARIDTHPRVSLGDVKNHYDPRRDLGTLNFPCFKTNAVIMSGMSGGPVIDSDGYICGVISYSPKYTSDNDQQNEFNENNRESYVAALWPIIKIPLGKPSSQNRTTRVNDLIASRTINAVDFDRYCLTYRLNDSVEIWRSPDQRVHLTDNDADEPFTEEQKEELIKSVRQIIGSPSSELGFDECYKLGLYELLNNNYQEALQYFIHAYEIIDFPILKINAKLQIIKIYKMLDRFDDAIIALNDIHRIYQTCEDDSIRIFDVIANYSQAQILYTSGRHEEALKQFETIMRINEHRSDNVSQSAFIESAYSRGILLHKMSRHIDAIASLDEAINKGKDSYYYDVKRYVAKSLNEKGSVFLDIDQFTTARSAYEKTIQSYKSESVTDLKFEVAHAYVGLGLVLYKMGLYEESISYFDIVINTFSEYLPIKAKAILGWSYVNKASALGHLNKHDEAIISYDLALKLFLNTHEKRFSELVTSAQSSKILTLSELNRSGDVVVECDKIISDKEYREFLDKYSYPEALMYKALALYHLGSESEAHLLLDSLVVDYSANPDIKIRNVVIQAQAYKAMLFSKEGCEEKALSIYSNIIEDNKHITDQNIRITISKLIISYGHLLEKLDKYEEALSIYNNLISRLRSTNNINLKVLVLDATIGSAVALAETGRDDDATDILATFLKTNSNFINKEISNLVADAHNIVGHLLQRKAKRLLKEKGEGAAEGFIRLLHDAEKSIISAMKIKPDLPIYQASLGYIYYLIGDIESSQKYLEKAVKDDGSSLKKDLHKISSYSELPQDMRFKEYIDNLIT